MTRAAPAQAQPSDRRARSEDAAAFSFPAAITALEARASTALKAFGGTPENAAPATAGAPRADSRAAASGGDDGASLTPRSTDENAEQPGRRGAQNAQPRAAGPAPAAAQQAARPAVQPAPLRTALGTAPAGSSAAPTQPQTSAALRSEAAAVRDIQKAQAPARAARPSAPVRPQAAPQIHDFARLLAHRLKDGDTRFELRLDPPELGRVEARLTIGDDGKAALAFKFENQTALDLFARDGAALRTALAASGFDLSGQDLSFTLADQDADTPSALAQQTAVAHDHAALASYEPLFFAPFSQGFVDLRI